MLSRARKKLANEMNVAAKIINLDLLGYIAVLLCDARVSGRG
jgi:hypothetical protein